MGSRNESDEPGARTEPRQHRSWVNETSSRDQCAGAFRVRSRSVVGMTPEEIADLAQLRRARDLMDRDHAQPLDVPAMARAALMSPAHFSRKFRAAYGETPYCYLMTRRIERAKALLRQGMSVTDTCVAVGCTSLGSFSSRFTEIVGQTPSQYRARDHRDLEVVSMCVSKSRRDRGAPEPRSERRRPTSRVGRHKAGSEKRAGSVGLRSSHVSHRVRNVHPFHDPDAALGFYRDALGLEVRNDVASDGFRWVTVGAPGEEVEIVLFQPHGGRSQVEGDALLSLVTKGSLQAAIFRSDDLDATFEKVRASGRGAARAGVAALGGARLRVPRPRRQSCPDRSGLTGASLCECFTDGRSRRTQQHFPAVTTSALRCSRHGRPDW